MLHSGLTSSAEPVVPVGAKVRIATGSADRDRRHGDPAGKRDQFVAVVQFLGRGATVDLQDWQVETITSRAIHPSPRLGPDAS